jgi:hypothetical protein
LTSDLRGHDDSEATDVHFLGPAESFEVAVSDDVLSVDQAEYNPEPLGIQQLVKRALIQEGKVSSVFWTERRSESFKCRQVLRLE